MYFEITSLIVKFILGDLIRFDPFSAHIANINDTSQTPLMEKAVHWYF